MASRLSWVRKHAVDCAAIAAQLTTQTGCGSEDGGRADEDRGTLCGRKLGDGGVLDEDRAAECGKRGVHEIDNKDLRHYQETTKLFDSHRLRAGAAGFAFAGWAKTSRDSFSSSRASSRSVATARSSSPRFMRTR